MFSSIFIDRPRLAVVISLVITIAGLVAMQLIPVAQFPNIVPPQVQVTANYAGASAEVVRARFLLLSPYEQGQGRDEPDEVRRRGWWWRGEEV